MIVISGSGEHQIDFYKYEVFDRQVHIMKPGQMHKWQLSKGIKGYLVEFNFQSLNVVKNGSRFFNDLSHSPDVLNVFSDTDFHDLVKISEIMLKESSEKREMQDICLQGLLTSFLVTIIRLLKSQIKKDKTLSKISLFKELVEENFRVEHGVEFYAKTLKTTTRALSMQLKRTIGRPPREIIQERLMLEAKRYLAFSDMTIYEIAYGLGFEDANYFTRLFRNLENKTPVQFRNESLNTKLKMS